MRTKTGQILTEDMIEALAREAEAGYDPAAPRPRLVGRPSLGEGASPRVQFAETLETETLETLQARARAEQRPISAIARAALARYLRGEPAGR